MNPQRLEIEKVIENCQTLIKDKEFGKAEDLLLEAGSRLESPPNLSNLLGVVYHLQSRFSDAIKMFQIAAEANPMFAEPVLNLTVTLCDLGQYEQAQSSFKEAINLHRGTKECPQTQTEEGRLANQHAALGDSYRQQSLFYKAISEYKTALSIFHSLPDVRLSLAKTYVSINEYESACKELVGLCEEYPSFVEGHLELGILHYRMKQKHLAKNAWMKAANLAPENKGAQAFRKVSAAWTFNSP